MDQQAEILGSTAMNLKQIALIFGLCLAVSHTAFAETDVFSLQRGFVYPDTFEGPIQGRQIGSVFQNPAGLAGAKFHQVKTDTSQNFIGFNQYIASYIAPIKRITVGIGYLNYSATDIPRSALGNNDRPTFVENFGFYNHLVSLGVGIPITPYLKSGAKLQYIWRRLDTTNAQGYAIDLGAIIDLGPFAWFGLHSHNLVSGNLGWDGTEFSDNLNIKGIAEFGVKWHNNWAKFAFDNTHHRFAAEWALINNFSILGDWVWQGSTSLRYSFGTILDFDTIAVQYTILNYTITGIDSVQHLLGLSVRLDPRIWKNR